MSLGKYEFGESDPQINKTFPVYVKWWLWWWRLVALIILGNLWWMGFLLSRHYINQCNPSTEKNRHLALNNSCCNRTPWVVFQMMWPCKPFVRTLPGIGRETGGYGWFKIIFKYDGGWATLILNLHQDDVADEDNKTRIEFRVQETAEKKHQQNMWI